MTPVMLPLRHTWSHLLALLVVMFAAFPGASAQDDSDARPPQPAARLLITARADKDSLWCRDWPLVLSIQIPQQGTPSSLLSTGLVPSTDHAGKALNWPWEPVPTPGTPPQAVWTLPSSALAQLPAGEYHLSVLQAGKVLCETSLLLSEAPPSPDDDFIKRSFRARLAYAVARNDQAAARSIADAYVARFPKDPDSHTALGNAQVASGDDKAASQAYLKAVGLWGKSIDPPQHLIELYNDAIGRLLARETLKPAAPPTRNELQFFKYVDEGDTAFAKGKFSAAVTSYERAVNQHKNSRLTQDLGLIEEKLERAKKRLQETKPAATTTQKASK